MNEKTIPWDAVEDAVRTVAFHPSIRRIDVEDYIKVYLVKDIVRIDIKVGRDGI